MSRATRGSADRASGVLLPISSLPGPYGVGDLGPAAERFVDWLHRSGQRYWQILPLSIPDSTGSPYASSSSAAGNWLFISPERLVRDGLLPPRWRRPRQSALAVTWPNVFRTKWALVRASYRHFLLHGTATQHARYRRFMVDQRTWLDDFSLFQALKDRHQQQPWWRWEKRWRDPRTAGRYLDARLEQHRAWHVYAQWLWHEQWQALRRYAHRRGVRIIGDMPFFVRADSVDVWAEPQLFLIDRRGRQPVVAGVPPDPFSTNGQRWGNPLYRWSAHQRQHFAWWVHRFQLLHERVDIIRFDHFRGLVHTWQIPARSPTAARGRWVPSPGRQVLRAVKRRVPRLDLIAEDLGPEGLDADALRRAFNLPTIRVLLFGWNGLPHNPHYPPRMTVDAILYTSNHDSNTTVGWWRQEAQPCERLHVREYCGVIRNIAAQSILSAAHTTARTIIVPVQDILSLGAAARFNRPGRKRGNWSWRLREGMLSAPVADRFRRLSRRDV